MIQAAKIIATGLATTGLIGAGVGIGVVFGALTLSLSYLGLGYLLFSIVITTALIVILDNNKSKFTFNIRILITSITIILLPFILIQVLDFVYILLNEVLSHLYMIKFLLMYSRQICMALPGQGSETVWTARSRDRITTIILGKICQRHNIPKELQEHMHDYFRFYWVNRFDKYINSRNND